MKPAPFAYFSAGSVEEAITLLGSHGDRAKVIAGGQSLVAMMNLRMARPDALVDIGLIPNIRYIHMDRDYLRIGALTTHAQLERYPLVLDGFECLQRTASMVGHVPIRARGTFGGSIAHADPAAEWCLLAVLYGAEMVVVGPSGTRTVEAQDFFRGFLTTAVAADELLTEVRFPRGFGFNSVAEYSRRHGDFGLVLAGVAFDVAGEKCRNVRIALGGVSDRAVRVPEAEELLEGELPSQDAFRAAAEIAQRTVDPPGDIHASAEYRRVLTRELLKTAFADAYGSG